MSLKRLLAAVTTVFVAVTSTAVSAVDYGAKSLMILLTALLPVKRRYGKE